MEPLKFTAACIFFQNAGDGHRQREVMRSEGQCYDAVIFVRLLRHGKVVSTWISLKTVTFLKVTRALQINWCCAEEQLAYQSLLLAFVLNDNHKEFAGHESHGYV